MEHEQLTNLQQDRDNLISQIDGLIDTDLDFLPVDIQAEIQFNIDKLYKDLEAVNTALHEVRGLIDTQFKLDI